MNRRIAPLAAAAVLSLALTACQSTASSDSSSGSGGGTSGGSSGGTSGGSSAVASIPDGASPSMNVDNGAAGPGNSGSAHARTSDKFDGCAVWFGFSQASSSTYLVSADKDGIGGHFQWKCDSLAVGVDRLRFTAHLQYAYTLAGPYTDVSESATSGGGTNPRGSLFPLTDHCTTDWWRIRVSIGWDQTGGGPQTRPDLISESRKVTSEDCNRS